MRKQRVTIRDRNIRRLNYTCPVCGSDLLRINDRACTEPYACGEGERCKGCHDWISSRGQVTLRLKCLSCGYCWSIMSRL
jgi:hypothetical protein